MTERWDSRQVAMWWAKILSIALVIAGTAISVVFWIFSSAYSLASKDYVDTSVNAIEVKIETLETQTHAKEQYERIGRQLDENSKEIRRLSDNILILGERFGVRRKMEGEHDAQ